MACMSCGAPKTRAYTQKPSSRAQLSHINVIFDTKKNIIDLKNIKPCPFYMIPPVYQQPQNASNF